MTHRCILATMWIMMASCMALLVTADGAHRSNESLKPAQAVRRLDPYVEAVLPESEDDSVPLAVKSESVYKDIKANSYKLLHEPSDNNYKIATENDKDIVRVINVANKEHLPVSTESVKGHPITKRFSEFVGKRDGSEDVSTDTNAESTNLNQEDMAAVLPVVFDALPVDQDGNQEDVFGKRVYDFVGKRSYDFVGKRSPYDFVGKRSPYDFVGKRSPYDFVGKRSSYDFLGKRSPYDFVGKRSPYDFVGKRSPYDFVGKRSPYDFVGKRSPYDFVGKRSPYDFVGKRSPYDFVGKRSPYDFVGKRSPYDFVGKRSPYDFVGKRSPYDFVGKRSSYEFVGKRSPYDFVGKRSAYEFDSTTDQHTDDLQGSPILDLAPTVSEYTKEIIINHKPQLTSASTSEAGDINKRYTEFLGKKKRTEEEAETVPSDSHRLAELLHNNGFRKRLSKILLTQKLADQYPEFIGKRNEIKDE